MREITLNIRVSDAEYSQLVLAAQSEGRSLGDIVRRRVFLDENVPLVSYQAPTTTL